MPEALHDRRSSRGGIASAGTDLHRTTLRSCALLRALRLIPFLSPDPRSQTREPLLPACTRIRSLPRSNLFVLHLRDGVAGLSSWPSGDAGWTRRLHRRALLHGLHADDNGVRRHHPHQPWRKTSDRGHHGGRGRPVPATCARHLSNPPRCATNAPNAGLNRHDPDAHPLQALRRAAEDRDRRRQRNLIGHA